ncbi:MAG: rRNA maturation RNase YbeY [Ilumatobacteraceae bacterium]|nr:rRNA maturation RNase YbeY [Ilumatobacteraceae bacterium]
MLEPHIKRNGPRKVGGDGEIEVFCADEQTDVAVDVARWHQLAKNVLVSEGVRGAAELTLMFVPESAIAGLNEKYMGKHGPTDVLSFPLDAVESVHTPGPGAFSRGPDNLNVDLNDLPILLGDVVVCPSVAKNQSSTHAGNIEDEFALLVTHGVLHVLGYDHEDERDAIKMQARERELLELHHWRGPMPETFSKVYE